MRQPFGGKRCIVGRLPLPPCCENTHCAAHLEKPTSATLEAASDESLKRVALKIVFAQHDADGSGECELRVAERWTALRATLLSCRLSFDKNSRQREEKVSAHTFDEPLAVYGMWSGVFEVVML